MLQYQNTAAAAFHVVNFRQRCFVDTKVDCARVFYVAKRECQEKKSIMFGQDC